MEKTGYFPGLHDLSISMSVPDLSNTSNLSGRQSPDPLANFSLPVSCISWK